MVGEDRRDGCWGDVPPSTGPLGRRGVLERLPWAEQGGTDDDLGRHRLGRGPVDVHGAIKVLARAHQNLIWTRQRQTNALRSALREYYRGALIAFEELHHPDALAVLAAAPDPERGRRLSEARIVAALRRGGRKRNLERRAREIRATLQAPQLTAPPLVVEAQAANTVALVAVIGTLNEQISRRNYADTAPITRASGTSHVVVARLVRNKRLFDPAISGPSVP